MPRSKKVFKKLKGKYYKRRNTINSKVITTDSKVNAQAGHAHDSFNSKKSCAKEKKIPNLNESFSSFDVKAIEIASLNFHERTQIVTVNTRFVYAMSSIGRGAEVGRMFCGIMNLPQPPTRFFPYGKRILNAAKLVYEDSIQNAAKDICENEALDESTDVSNTAQVLIFIRGVDKSYEVYEELLDVDSIHGTTTEANIFKGVENAINKKNLR
ncbi:uncharacterized protein TNIN_16591 [Trichonephila inaurata madagascariensis]|uniref:Uncharacterized protein n=1 Tax=Trichonephila inaurata madagascariensis TaxID=2747483 RepID=A0A8X6YRV5_9ARAC|nr:uncharacterized protein TNIN_16591 [Trichonephila inaurata madagascariensis]